MTIELTSEVEQLARRLAGKTGTTPENAIKEAVEQRARALGVDLDTPRPPFNEAGLRATLARLDQLPILDDRTADEIIGYNEYGVPE